MRHTELLPAQRGAVGVADSKVLASEASVLALGSENLVECSMSLSLLPPLAPNRHVFLLAWALLHC